MKGSHTVLLGLGSNLGNRCSNIRYAFKKLKEFSTVKRTSYLYETEPAYIHNQPKFLNAACKIYTDLSPDQLLNRLKTIETDIGKKVVMKNGPRLIDIDVLFYDNLEIQQTELKIPHPLFAERDFVLKPLCDINPDFVPPTFNNNIKYIYEKLKKAQKSTGSHISEQSRLNPMKRVWPVGPDDKTQNQDEKTFLMGVLNVTPDSFSDGGQFLSKNNGVDHADKMFNSGADIVDIGGTSTRPDSFPVSECEELDRVIPVIELIRKNHPNMPLSIDTFRNQVAKEAVNAGATVVNDISGGDFDPKMLSVVCDLEVPLIAMHMRGNPKNMQSLTHYENLIEDLKSELGLVLLRSQDAGIPLQDIVLDPGIGFSKDAEQCYRCLQYFRDLSPKKEVPFLSGPSRKSFMKLALGEDTPPLDRVWGTAAACSASIAGGANILRVHDVPEILDVIKVSDKIWRRL